MELFFERIDIVGDRAVARQRLASLAEPRQDVVQCLVETRHADWTAAVRQ